MKKINSKKILFFPDRIGGQVSGARSARATLKTLIQLGHEVTLFTGDADKILAYGKAGTVGLDGEIEHASAFIHTLRFGNKFRDAVGGTSYLSFTNTRGPAGSKISIPMMHKTDSGLRPYYLTHEFTIHDAPFDDEVVIAIGGASSGRAHARTGDRYQDMKEMGIKN